MSEPQIELSVKVTDGSFDARIALPITATQDEISKFVSSWLATLGTAVEMLKREAACGKGTT